MCLGSIAFSFILIHYLYELQVKDTNLADKTALDYITMAANKTRLLKENREGVAPIDFILASILLNPLLMTLFYLNVKFSAFKTARDWILFLLRMSNCFVIAAGAVSILTYSMHRRIVVLSVIVSQAIGCLIYSWMAPLYRWYLTDFRRKGLIYYLPRSLQDTLLRSSLLDWLSSSDMYENVSRYFPFLFKLTAQERSQALQQLEPPMRRKLQQKGMVRLFPQSVQRVMLPVQDSEPGQLRLSETLTFGFNFDVPTPERPAPLSPSNQVSLQQLFLSRFYSGFFGSGSQFSVKQISSMATLSLAILVLQIARAPKRHRETILFLLRVALGSSAGVVALASVSMGLLKLSFSSVAAQISKKSRRSLQHMLQAQTRTGYYLLSKGARIRRETTLVASCIAFYLAYKRLTRLK